MSYLPLPKYISKRNRDREEVAWRATDLQVDAPAPDEATCMRCAQSISDKGIRCNKPANLRCRACARNNRPQCTLVPPEFNARVSRLHDLYRRYSTAVAAVPDRSARKANVHIQAAGLALARFQKLFNKELARRRLIAGRTGESLSLPTHVPESSEDFMALDLVERRRQSAALEDIANLMRRALPALLSLAAGNHDSDDDSSFHSFYDDDEPYGGGGGEEGAPEVNGAGVEDPPMN